MRMLFIRIVYVLILIFSFQQISYAQFELNGQLVQRAEYRDGYGKLNQDTFNSAAFVSQRLRLQAKYKSKNIEFYGSVQDIRTWGSTSQIKVSDNFLSLHEGWVNLKLDSFWSAKLGRQELNYDNARFLGNLDWAMQARAHDFALVKFNKKNHLLHFGGGFNQNSENLSGNIYTQANQYKTAQMIWYNYKTIKFEGSFLFWNNGIQFLLYDSTGKNLVSHDLRFTQTIACPNLKYTFFKNNVISGFGYYQIGKDVANKVMNAYDVSLQSSQTMLINNERNIKFKVTVGAELISGTSTNSTSKSNQSFVPMYGTNHAHNGYMDYFFVGGRFENKTGLNDLFIKLRLDMDKKWFIALDGHSFTSNADIYISQVKQDKKLGAEIDLTGGYVLNEDVSLQIGYSQMFASQTLKNIQANNAGKIQNWAYLMLIIRPKSDKKFIGVLN